MTPLIFGAQSAYHAEERSATPERLVNMFPEAVPAGRAPVALRSSPGQTRRVALGSPVRAVQAAGTVLYAVAGGQLWEIGADYQAVSRGAVTDDVNTVLAWSGTELAIVADSRYFVWNGTTLDEVTSAPFTSFESVAYIDASFVLTQKGGQQFAITAVNDGKTIDGLDFASMEAYPDDIRRVFVDQDEVWLFGDTSIEIWQSVGGADFPLAPIPGAVITRGIGFVRSIAAMDNTMYWVGDDGLVYRAAALSPQSVSTPPVAAAIASSSDVAGFVYEYGQHKFYVLRLDGIPAWQFDPATGAWSERASGTALGPWKATCSAFFNGSWHVGCTDGSISQIDRVWTEDGQTLRRECWSRNFHRGGNRFTVPEVDFQITSEGTVMFQISDDVGRNWSRERLLPTQPLGDRVKTHRLGNYRDFAMRLSMADANDFAMYGASMRVV